MENTNNIVQTALDEHVRKVVVAKRLKNHKMFLLIGMACGYSLALCLWVKSIGDIPSGLLVGILPALMGAALFSSFYAVTIPFGISKETTNKLLVPLTEAQKRDIVATYLEEEIKKCEDNIIYCQQKSESFQRSIDQSKQEQEKLKLYLTDLHKGM